MIVAGGESAARILRIVIFHILSNVDVLRCLQDEVVTTMPDVSKIPSMKVLKELPYLVLFRALLLLSSIWYLVTNLGIQAVVIKEALRISASVTLRSPLMAHQGLSYKDVRRASFYLSFCHNFP